MKTLKTALSLLMVLCLLLSLGAAAFAEGEEGSGEPAPAPAEDSAPASGQAGKSVENNYNTSGVQTQVADPAPAHAANQTPDTSPTLNFGVTVTASAVDGTKVEVIGVDSATSVDSDGTSTPINQVSLGDNKVGIVIPPDTTTWVPDLNGVPVTYSTGNPPEVDIGGSIAANTSETPGLRVDNFSTNIVMNVGDENTVGNVTSAGGDGIIANFQGDSSKLTVWGNVEGNGSNMGSGITVISYSGDSEIDVKGDVSGGSAAPTAAGIAVFNEASLAVNVTGNVKGSDAGGGINVSEAYGDTTITVGSVDSDGNVTGGTVTGGIKLDGVPDGYEDKTSITVWKVDGEITGASDSVIKSVINYLVGLVQPNEGSISAPKTAKESEKVYLTAGKGYRITAAYSEGDTKTELQKDSKGFYYTVERGGGILLSALLEKIKPAAVTDDWSDGYYLFNKAVVKQIKAAEENGTVTVDGTGWASFMRMVFEALAERPDVTLVVKYGTNKELTVPAGTDVLGLIGSAQDVLFTKLAKLVG